MKSLVIVCLLYLSLPTFLMRAQLPGLVNTTTTPVAGVPHDYINDLSEIVNPANGSLSVRIGAPTPPERGTQWKKYLLLYDTNGFYNITASWLPADSVYHANIFNYGTLNDRVINVPGFIDSSTANLDSGYLDPNHTVRFACQNFSGYVYTDPDGGRHALNLSIGYSQAGGSSGCSYFGLTNITGGGDETYKAYIDPDTRKVSIVDLRGNSPLLEDVNGNVAWNSGRQTVTSSTSTPNQAGTYNFSLPGANGNFTSVVSSYTRNAQFSIVPIPGSLYCSPSQATPMGGTNPGVPVPASISLPTGYAYQFTTDPTSGFISQITYPTGAKVSYTWSIIPQNEGVLFRSPGATNGGYCGVHHDVFAITKRVVSYDGATPAQEQDFSYQTTWDTGDNGWKWLSKTTTVTTKDLIRNKQFNTVYTYSPMLQPNIMPGIPTQTSLLPVESSIAYYDFDSSLKKTVTKIWQTPSIMAAECETLPGVGTSGRFYTYKSASVSGNATQNTDGFSSNLPTDAAEYDYGKVQTACTRPSTTPDKETQTTYWTPTGAAPPFFPQNVIFDRPSSVKTFGKDGSGNQVLMAETEYGYDETGVQSVAAGLIGHDASYKAGTNSFSRGNATTITGKCLQNCADMSSTLTYNEAGQVISQTDPKNSAYIYRYGYTDQYSSDGGSPAGNTNIFMTSLNRPSVNGVTFLSQYTYGFQDGGIRSLQDENGKTTYVCYGLGGCGQTPDTWYRVGEIQYPDGGDAKATYNDQPANLSMTVTKLQGVSANGAGESPVVSKTSFDTMGREAHIEITSDPSGTVTVDKTYDGLGKVMTVSNPHRQGDPIANTVLSYDSLGRSTVSILPDTVPRSTFYTGNQALTTDENNAKTSRYFDSWGRLTDVYEDPSGLNLHTVYGYDVLNNLLVVNQVGKPGTTPAGFPAGSQAETAKPRSFSYDSLGRLITSTNPETGTVCYGLWSGSSCVNGYDKDGNLLYKTDASGMTVSYSYDALNRMVRKTAPDSYNTNVYMIYDQGANGIGRLSEAGNTNYNNGALTDGEIYGQGGTRFSYDAMGRITNSQRWAMATSIWSPGVSARYDLAGNVTQLSYPDGRVVNQVWDAAGRLSSVTDATPNGAGTQYMNDVQYWPSGAPMSSAYGNGVSQSFTLNSRLQSCRSMAFTPLLASNPGGGNLFDRQSFYNPATSSPCGNEASNNGNIYSIVDNRQPGMTQSFSYDSLNRLHTAFRSDGAYNHQYAYDSFGNMLLQDNVHTAPNYSIEQTTNRLLQNGTDLTYYPNGTLASSPGHSYSYTAEGYLRSIDNYSTGSYVYNGLGERVLAVHSNNSSNDYVYFNGQPMADMDNSGVWSDYIYANGQKIAKVLSQKPMLHLRGTRNGNSSCGAEGPVNGVLAGVAGYTIQSGDRMSMSVQQNLPTYGGLALIFTSGTGSGDLTDTLSAGHSAASFYFNGTADGQWHNMVGDLTPYAGLTIAYVLGGIHQNAPDGTFDLAIADAALLTHDGQTIPILTGQAASVGGGFYGNQCGGSNLSSGTEPTSVSDAKVNTSYYLTDHLGSTQMELSGGGWPLWQGQFTPFGQEIVNGNTLMPGTPDGSSSRYKFTGKERDSESGLDYFGARYYASSMGRWMSPDWSANPEAVPYSKLDNPQSLNLYQYVLNNPLSQKDDDGHEIIYASGLKNEQLVRDSVTAILANPNTSGYLSGYVGPNNPNLTIQSGDLGPPTVTTLPDGRTLTVTTQGNTAPDIQTATMTDNNGVKTSETTLTGATITIDNNTSKGDTPGVMIHESVHAGEAKANPAKFAADAKAEKSTPHDQRPQEQRANGVRAANEKQIKQQIKQIEKDRKKDQQ